MVGGLCLPSQLGRVYCVIGQGGQMSFHISKLTEETKTAGPALTSSFSTKAYM